MKLKVFFRCSVLAIFIIFLVLGFGYSMFKLDNDKNKFYECDDIYEHGECLFYQCKMNYSTTIDRSWSFYDLYHQCLMKEKDCVLTGKGDSEE